MITYLQLDTVSSSVKQALIQQCYNCMSYGHRDIKVGIYDNNRIHTVAINENRTVIGFLYFTDRGASCSLDLFVRQDYRKDNSIAAHLVDIGVAAAKGRPISAVTADDKIAKAYAAAGLEIDKSIKAAVWFFKTPQLTENIQPT